jgi:hypothetical protein
MPKVTKMTLKKKILEGVAGNIGRTYETMFAHLVEYLKYKGIKVS